MMQVISISCLLCTASFEKQTADQVIPIPNVSEQKELTILLNDIYDKDQKVRQSVYSTIEKYGLKSPQIKELAKRMDIVDSTNLVTVKAIIAKYGWLSSNIVGKKGNSALFLVVQHSPEKDQKHFLPIMRQAVQNNAADKQDLALLEDRVATDQGKKQFYGTQIGFNEKTKKYYVFPIDNPKDVDERRAKLGMIPMAAYLSQWQIKWEVKH